MSLFQFTIIITIHHLYFIPNQHLAEEFKHFSTFSQASTNRKVWVWSVTPPARNLVGKLSKFSILSENLSCLIVARYDDKIINSSSLSLHHCDAKKELIAFITKGKGVNFLGDSVPKLPLSFLSNYVPSIQLHVVSILPCSVP